MKSTYWIGRYLDGVDGGPYQEAHVDTLREARRIEKTWESCNFFCFCRVQRVCPEGNFHDIRGQKSCLPQEIQHSLADAGFTSVI